MKLSPQSIYQVSGIKDIDDSSVARAEQYCTGLIEANRKINLISRGGDQQAEIERQLLISLAPIPYVPTNHDIRWLDIGSGGGFPGIPLAIFCPHIRFSLAESVTKKAFFLERTAQEIGLENVEVLNQRIECPVNEDERQIDRYDWLSVKAVTAWEETIRWGAAFLHPRGTLLTYKAGIPSVDEMRTIRAYGFELIHTIDISEFFKGTTLKILMLRSSEIRK